MQVTPRNVLALDVGMVRVGVAIASLIALLPRPLVTLQQDETFFEKLKVIVSEEEVGAIVVGYPRGMQGQQTQQTDAIVAFTEELKEHIIQPIYLQDEALTSKHAETELIARGKQYQKGDIDALAATYILDDFLREHPSGFEVTA
ncbi:MAG: Holliday junction resolvase RuvX [Patescibacteria group bacterium]|nr:Holliday junction resolvase RuvX [Patescibacteria group bacterium]